MTSPPVYLTRNDWGADPVVRSSSGAPRPALAKPARWITVHYTGNSSPLTTADRAAVIAAQQGLERYAAGADKPNEYNYVLYSDNAEQGYVVEYAGPYQAAHSSGENAQAVGVLFYVGVDQGVPDCMVDAYRYLRDVTLYPSGLAVPGSTSQTPHKDMPDAATPCPGPVMGRWNDLLLPYAAAPTPTGPPLVPGRVLVRNGTDTHWNAYVCHAGGKWWVKTNEALSIVTAELGPPVPVSDDWMVAHGPVVGDNPGRDAYGCWAG